MIKVRRGSNQLEQIWPHQAINWKVEWWLLCEQKQVLCAVIYWHHKNSYTNSFRGERRERWPTNHKWIEVKRVQILYIPFIENTWLVVNCNSPLVVFFVYELMVVKVSLCFPQKKKFHYFKCSRLKTQKWDYEKLDNRFRLWQYNRKTV